MRRCLRGGPAPGAPRSGSSAAICAMSRAWRSDASAESVTIAASRCCGDALRASASMMCGGTTPQAWEQRWGTGECPETLHRGAGGVGLVQEEAGGGEHAALVQAAQARDELGVGRLPRRDGRGVVERAQAVLLRLVHRVAEPREVVGDAARALPGLRPLPRGLPGAA